MRRDLVAAGVPAPQLLARASKSPGTAKVPSVLLKLEKDARAKLVKEPHPWPVAAHDFAHMLGFLDEYIPSDDHDTGEFRAFSDDCVKYGNLAKPRFGVRGTSIMSWGYHVFPGALRPRRACARGDGHGEVEDARADDLRSPRVQAGQSRCPRHASGLHCHPLPPP